MPFNLVYLRVYDVYSDIQKSSEERVSIANSTYTTWLYVLQPAMHEHNLFFSIFFSLFFLVNGSRVNQLHGFQEENCRHLILFKRLIYIWRVVTSAGILCLWQILGFFRQIILKNAIISSAAHIPIRCVSHSRLIFWASCKSGALPVKGHLIRDCLCFLPASRILLTRGNKVTNEWLWY